LRSSGVFFLFLPPVPAAVLVWGSGAILIAQADEDDDDEDEGGDLASSWTEPQAPLPSFFPIFQPRPMI
jgi:hypothetical protein